MRGLPAKKGGLKWEEQRGKVAGVKDARGPLGGGGRNVGLEIARGNTKESCEESQMENSFLFSLSRQGNGHPRAVVTEEYQ